VTTASNICKNNVYIGAAYWHPEHQQIVIAHRGTRPTNLGALWTHVISMVFNQLVPQMAHKFAKVLQDFNPINGVCFQLFFT